MAADSIAAYGGIPLGGDRVGGAVELRYVARAGLLPELSRQTYDRFYKAIREAVLNSADASASRVVIDFRGLPDRAEIEVSDDGHGMTMRELCENFMALGGSARFGNNRRYGRIGIGSLALLQYGSMAVVETKKAGAATFTRARINHPWTMSGDTRRIELRELAAGSAEEFEYLGHHRDQFTRITVSGVNRDVVSVGVDPSALYRLLDDLQRTLPLRLSEGPLIAALRRQAADIVERLEEHVNLWSIPVVIHTPWESDIHLSRRMFGDEQGASEAWNGVPLPVRKRLTVRSQDGSRRCLEILGFLLSQRRAIDAWSGITARVQNVAVEEHTFFDVTSDPGFRKYISGEIWILGDVDRERLINIDRSSFNRESDDYRVLQRFLHKLIVDFKSVHVQRPQRQKVEVRRLIERYRATARGLSAVVNAARTLIDEDMHALPSSEPGRLRGASTISLRDRLERLGIEVVLNEDSGSDNFHVEVRDLGGLRVCLDSGLAHPEIWFGTKMYRVAFVDGGEDAPPAAIRNRPRRILLNVSHPAHLDSIPSRYQMSVALEIAYLLNANRDPADLYETLTSLMACTHQV